VSWKPITLLFLVVTVALRAQNAGRGSAPLPANPYANAYPQHPPGDPESVARGKALFEVNCAFCHGSDARGGDSGPNLLRAEIILRDDKGEAIAPVLREGRPAQGMPKFELSDAQIADIAAYIHSFRVAGYDNSRNRPVSIVVGDARGGEVFFKAKCASCHSPTGDLAGIATRFEDPRLLQQRWLLSNSGRPPGGFGAAPSAAALVVVTQPNGKITQGRLVRIDDFTVSLIDSDGARRTFRRDGDVPKVEIRDPLSGHKDLLRVYSDKDIHDVTAYLVTLK
jgi:cytochrome c oxidase cbb3-type subunit III